VSSSANAEQHADVLKWNHNLGPAALFDLSRDGGSTWSTLAAAAGQSGSKGVFSWTVTGPVTTQGRIRVTWTVDGSVTDQSNLDFSIVN
jgi:hypothetical protein